MSVTFEVLIKGKSITQYHHEGEFFVEGRPGSEYELKITNKYNKQVIVIVSVDGLSVIDGKLASSDSPSYLVNPHSSIVIPGWMLDSTRVAKFVFGDRKDSYATASTNGAEVNCGVFGVLVYEQKPRITRGFSLSDAYSGMTGAMGSIGGMASPTWTSNSPGYPKASGATINQLSVDSPTVTYSAEIDLSATTNNLGTGFGDAAQFSTREIDVEKGNLIGQIVVQYDDKKGLERRGIDVKSVTYARNPNPFPGGTGCVPPAGWRR